MAIADEPDRSLAIRRAAYEHYTTLKGWAKPFTYDDDMAAAFAGELGTSQLSGKSLLEIGFGEGSLLAWAQERGAQVVGAEIDKNSLAEATKRGIELITVDLGRASEANRERFDYIVAFDVFEHLTLPQVDEGLRACATMLKPEGQLILRFPNCESPFGLAVHHSDVTHLTPLSGEQLRQIVASMPLELMSVRRAHRVRGRNPGKWIVRSLRYIVQDSIQLLVRFAFMDSISNIAPVVTAHLKRASAKPGAST